MPAERTHNGSGLREHIEFYIKCLAMSKWKNKNQHDFEIYADTYESNDRVRKA